MVTKYSGRTGSVKGRTKLVLTYSPTSVKNSTSSVKVTAKFYYESKYRTQDSFNTGKLSGSLGSWSGGFSINGTSKLIKTITKTVSTSYSGSKKITVTGTLQTIEASPGAHKVTASIRIPKRPVARPHTPSNVNMALLSDNRTKTTWSHSTSTARPVSSYTVQYQRLDGGSWTGWMHSATVKGKSYTSNPGANNKSYRRRVRANNSAGSSRWAYSNYVRMQPYAPVNVRAKVQPSGSGIKVTWDFNNPAETTCLKLQLQRRVNGGSWANVSSSFGQVKSKPYTSSYTDTTPGAGSNQYRIRILNDCEGDDSVWSESNTVSTIVPPKAPTNLSPDGNVVDFTGDVLFTWQHHDAGDGADQTHYDLRYRAEGESAWTFAQDGGAASEKSEHLFESGELVNGVNYEWQVHTQGNTKEDYGPWSKSAFVTGWTAPVVAINEGTPPNPLTALPVPLAWTYAQDEGQGQIAWETRLYELGSGDMFDSILEEKSAQSVSQSTIFSTVLTDGARYGVSVRARSSKGQWSEWAETTFDVELLVPADTRIDLSYNEETGQMNLHVVADTAVQDETAAVVEIDVERRINGGVWEPIMLGIPFDAETTLVDNIPSLWGVNEYRVSARTDAPSSARFGPFRKTVTPYGANDENRLFLNWGETFDFMATMQGDLSTSGSYDRSKETQKLLGRKKPISLLGDQLSREHSVTGVARYFPGVCDVDPVLDEPVELVGSRFFGDAAGWDYSQVVAGPESGVTGEAHYRAKAYGYLMDVVDGNTDNLVSPSPRSGVPGSEVPGREVEETVARNLWLGSKLSVDDSALGGNANGGTSRQTSEGKEWTAGPPATGATSYVYTNSRVQAESGVPYSWAIPLKNTGTVPFPVRVFSWLQRSTSGSVAAIEFVVLEPGEVRVVKLENMLSDYAQDIRFSVYYYAEDEKPAEGAKITLLDGITLVADDVAADPFNGDGPRWAPDGSSIELVTDSQSLYRWTGAVGASASEEYLPVVEGHFEEYTDMLTVDGGASYALEAFVRAPGLTIGSRVNLTSQGALSSDRQLWGSASVKSNGAAWSASGGTVTEGALNLSRAFSMMGSVTPAFGTLATKVKASTVRQTDLAGRTFTFGVNVSADGPDDLTADKTNVRFEYFDSAGDRIQVGGSNYDNHGLSTTDGEGRTVFTVTMPAGTEAFDIGVINQNTSTGMYLDAVTFESGITDGTWIEQDGVEERFGVENIDTVDLIAEAFDASGESLTVDTVATLEKDEFSSRWRTISGEYSPPAEATTARVWVEWNVNGEHPASQSDWYMGGMSAVETYSVPDRWPGPDANPDDWRQAQYESTTVCLRTPYGVRVFGAMSGLEVSPVDGTLDLSQVSFTVTETDYTENPLVIDESDIWDNIVLEPQGGLIGQVGIGPLDAYGAEGDS